MTELSDQQIDAVFEDLRDKNSENSEQLPKANVYNHGFRLLNLEEEENAYPEDYTFSKEEFRDLIRKEFEGNSKLEMLRALSKLDKAGTGYVDRNDLRELLLKDPVWQEDDGAGLDSVLDECDHNKDGKFNIIELANTIAITDMPEEDSQEAGE